MQLIEVAFKGNRKEFYLWERDELPGAQASVIVDADRGEDLGAVYAIGELAQRRYDGVGHGRLTLGEAPTKRVRRVATVEEVRRAREVREQDEPTRRRTMERVKAHNLVMKVSDAEWQWDRKKLTIYFTAEKRVDFRNLVRDLASLFRTRIELKQIGVRDEAKRLDGVGRCGRQYCSASWLPELRPVNLGVAKDQRLSLNPSQISGACGRLMCCLRYEHEFYVQSRKRFPKEGKILATGRGEEKVVANDIFNERVTLRSAEGETRVVALADLRQEMSGGMPTPQTEEMEIPSLEMLDEELIRLQDTAERPAFRPGGRPLGEEGPVALKRRTPAQPADRARPRPTTTPEKTPPLATAGTAAPPDGDVEHPADGMPDDGAPGEGERAEGERPHRRRRGRRGGRRGRGRRNSEGGVGTETAATADGTRDDGDDGADDGSTDDGASDE
jgi:cell fate regulator YaaT (PSP1 superfamily)